MPWYPGVSARLTDDQLWAIICADPSVSNRQLAETLGANVGTVTHARRRLRRHGWTCRVTYRPCQHCGRLVTRPITGRGRRVYHPACTPAATQTRRQAGNRRRWAARHVEERRDELARAHAYLAEHQVATQATATQWHARWTEAEDAVLIARHDEPAPVLAAALGRTLHGVYRRRDRLRARGLLP